MADEQLYENVYYSKNKPESAQNELLKKTQGKVDELVEILHDNVEKALERDQKLQDLNEISETLEKRASEFTTVAIDVKRKQRWARMKTKIVFAGLGVLLLIIVILIIIHSLKK